MTPGLVAIASDEAIYLSKTLSKFLSEVYARHRLEHLIPGRAGRSQDPRHGLVRRPRSPRAEVAREAESLACSAPLPEPGGDKNQNVLVSRRDRLLPAKNSVRRRANL